MRTHIKQEWVTRLRSGIPQVFGVLAIGDARCAMGVLCDIATERGIIAAKKIFHEDGISVLRIAYGDGCETSTPHEVIKWAAMTREEVGQIEDLNDSGCSFEDIASFINESL